MADWCAAVRRCAALFGDQPELQPLAVAVVQTIALSRAHRTLSLLSTHARTVLPQALEVLTSTAASPAGAGGAGGEGGARFCALCSSALFCGAVRCCLAACVALSASFGRA